MEAFKNTFNYIFLLQLETGVRFRSGRYSQTGATYINIPKGDGAVALPLGGVNVRYDRLVLVDHDVVHLEHMGAQEVLVADALVAQVAEIAQRRRVLASVQNERMNERFFSIQHFCNKCTKILPKNGYFKNG